MHDSARFGGGLLLGAAVSLLLLRATLGTGMAAGSQPTPRPPDWRREYPSAYRGISATHTLLSLGVFGLGQRVREADVLLAGSSHAEFGFSAQELTAYFRRHGTAIKAYNIGVGWGEGFAFPSALIDRYNLHDKILVVDLYRVIIPLSPTGEQALHDNAAAKLVRLANMWLSFSADRALDGVLPQIETPNAKWGVTRRLDQSVMYRRWADGDLSEFWVPALGRVFQTWSPPYDHPNPNADAEQIDTAAFKRVVDARRLAERRLTTLATFIPFESETGKGHLEAAARAGIPVLLLAGEKIQLLDTNGHATIVGRLIITEQVAAALINRHMRVGRP